MSNSHFKRGSGVFTCRHCKRRTRDTDGDNGSVELCADCHQGCMYENGGNDTSDEKERDDCFALADACFQRAVNKGGTINGFSKEEQDNGTRI
jgi:hypothetical protein